MKRRSFIRASIILVTTISIPLLFKKYQLFKWKRFPLIHPVILSHFCDEETIQKIGIGYRSIVPAENSERQLHALLLNTLAENERNISDPAVLSNLLNRKIQKEFNAEKIVIVNGWVLSEPESRQCALLTFSE